MVPNTLNEWTYDGIKALCAVGQFESDRHDFKFNLAHLKDPAKICCAFANTFGGFIVVGVGNPKEGPFEVVGLDADKELYGNFLKAVRVEPQIDIETPKAIAIPNSAKLLYVFSIPQSPRRPHLPIDADKRIFWKRQGSDCAQMTLEEIRYQMNSYEEKREKLALLLIDLHHKVRSLSEEANLPDGRYWGDLYSFDIIDRVVVEAYSILKDDIDTIGSLDRIERQLAHLNGEKQMMLTSLTHGYAKGHTIALLSNHRSKVNSVLQEVATRTDQIERSLKEKFGIENPYRARS